MSIEDDLARIAEQQKALVFDTFGLDEAWRLGSLLRAWSVERGHAVAIDVRFSTMPAFYAALPGSIPDNENWIRRKRNLVLRMFQSSYAIGRKLELQGATVEAKYGLSSADYTPHGGSFPITVKGGGVIGAATVSGLVQRDDHELVVEALAHMTGVDLAGIRLP
ncbi:MAG: heme-degrading domain-containing protein [Neorhizobium sp.]|nr:heme-degrading domain-containing protein [Neorhizobium sp.]